MSLSRFCNCRALVVSLMLAAGLTAGVGTNVVTATPAGAQDTCTFTTKGANWKLASDCTTDQTITVPSGLTLNGQGHTISAVDPVGGPFAGPVVVNGGTTMNVKDVTINGDFTNGTCNSGLSNEYAPSRLRGIEFLSASGSIKGTTVANINKGAGNTCDEGFAVEFNSFAGGGPYTVTATNDTLTNFQTLGFESFGNVKASIKNDTVSGYASSGNSGSDVYFAGVSGGEVSSSNLTIPSGFYSSTDLQDSSNVQIKHNTANGALVVFTNCTYAPQSSGNALIGNTVTGVSFAIQITSVEQDPYTTCSPQANGNVVKSNTLTESGGAVGVNIYVGAPGTYTPSASNNSVINNTISGYSTPVGDGGTNDTVKNNHT